ncbi:phospho-acceptor domain-containing protein [Archangium gephyra]|uniref:histidine kinase n=2 Tax=Archangium gephyra TaxID=48 RepID=A0ABX9JS68_9BACT|nr:ATP-binding protein [Archangium gephyra]REG26036.1 phospho-acceptor domain-containing protein [Archangium gephyra]
MMKAQSMGGSFTVLEGRKERAEAIRNRLLKAEAELSEREMRHHNALLEETVRQRTCELELANARLQESLKQLQATQAQLLFADRLATIGQLAAGLGHEINNPLAFIVGNLDYVQQQLIRTGGVPTPEEKQEMIEAIADARDGAERVSLIVRDLKVLSHPNDMERGPVDVVASLRSAVKVAAYELRDRASLVEELVAVPPVNGHKARLCQVFLNLLINAAHALPPGQAVRNEIRLSTRMDGPHHVAVEVSDTGCGIPPENLERIFNPFFTTKPVGVGTGLGLSVCHGIITALGGKISVRSEVGQGTTFTVSLPVYEASAEQDSSAQEELTSRAA